MKSILTLIGVVIVGAAVGLMVWRDRGQVKYEQDRAQIDWQAAKLAEEAIKKGDMPYSWDLGVFISNSALQKLTSTLEGTKLAFDDDDAVVTIDRATISAMPTILMVDLKLHAESPKRSASVNLAATAYLLHSGVEPVDAKIELIQFSVVPVEITAELRWFGLDFRGGQLASDLLTSGLLPQALKAAPLSLPFQNTISAHIGTEQDHTIDVNKDLHSTLTYHQTIPGSDLVWKSQSVAPLFLKTGIWLLATSSPFPNGTRPQDPGGRSNDVLRSETAAIRAAVEKIAPPAGEASVWLASKPVLYLIDQFAALPAEKRTMTMQSTKIDGKIAEQKWRDDVLGDGGTFAEFVDNHAAAGTVVIDQLKAGWIAKNGVSLEVGAHANATANVRVHIDPLVGGGAGTTVGLVGKASTRLTGALGLDTATVDGTPILATHPTFKCSDMMIDLESDGRAQTDLGWTKVPSIGIRQHQQLDLSGLKPQLLFDGLPSIIHGREKNGDYKQVRVGQSNAILQPQWRYLLTSVSPLNVAANDNGWLVTAGVTVKTADKDESAAIATKRDQLRSRTADLWKSPSCGGEPTTEVKLGPFLIGPNNEIVKLFVRVGKFTKEVGERIGHEVSTEKLKEWVKDPAGSFARSTPAKVVTNPAGAVKDAIDSYCDHNWCP